MIEIVRTAGGNVTIQDLGRPGYAHLGVGRSGAADRGALRLANRLVGNDPGAAAIELMLVGGSFALLEGNARVALFHGTIWATFDAAAPGQTVRVDVTKGFA